MAISTINRVNDTVNLIFLCWEFLILFFVLLPTFFVSFVWKSFFTVINVNSILINVCCCSWVELWGWKFVVYLTWVAHFWAQFVVDLALWNFFIIKEMLSCPVECRLSDVIKFCILVEMIKLIGRFMNCLNFLCAPFWEFLWCGCARFLNRR